jgi:hypothetical protein
MALLKIIPLDRRPSTTFTEEVNKDIDNREIREILRREYGHYGWIMWELWNDGRLVRASHKKLPQPA